MKSLVGQQADLEMDFIFYWFFPLKATWAVLLTSNSSSSSILYTPFGS